MTPPIQRFRQCLFSWCYICYSTRPSSPQARERLVAWRRRSFPSRKEFLPCWEEMNGNETYSCIILIFMWCVFAVFFEMFFHQLLGFLQCHTSSVPKNEKRSFPEKPTGLNPLIHGQGPITGHIETSGPTAPKHHSTGEPSRDQGLTNDSQDPHDGSLHAKHRYMQPRKISPKVNLEEGSQLKDNLPVYKIWQIYRHLYIYISTYTHKQLFAKCLNYKIYASTHDFFPAKPDIWDTFLPN